MYNKILKYYAIFLLCLALLSGCASQYLQLSVTRPAEINLNGFDKIAIGDIEGQNGRINAHSKDISERLTSAVFESKRFDVLDIATLMKEHNLMVSGLINEKKASKLGEFIGAAVFVTGRIQTDTYDEEIEKDKEWVDKKGNYHQSIRRNVQYRLAIHLSFVDMKSTKILAIKDISTIAKESTYADRKEPEKIDINALYARSLDKITVDFMRLIAPYRVTVTAEFLTDNKLPELQQAINQFKGDYWDKGISLLESVTQKENLDPTLQAKAFYDMGLAQMYTGRYDEAIQNLEKAISLDPKKSMYLDTLLKAKREKEIADQVKQQK